MKINAVELNDGRLVLFRADSDLNEATEQLIARRRPGTEYQYEIETKDFYLRNKTRIDVEIEHRGYHVFDLAKDEKVASERRRAVEKAMNEHGSKLAEID